MITAITTEARFICTSLEMIDCYFQPRFQPIPFVPPS
jgi:hypothetical protein